MGTWNEFYVKARFDDVNAIMAIREKSPDAEIEPSEEYLGVRMPDDCFEAPEAELAKLSAKLKTEVLWMGLQSAVEAFIFHHWRDGKRVRSLVHGCMQEGLWERVVGRPEPWERDVLFDPRRLKIPLESAKTAAEQRELRRIWKAGELKAGRSVPFVDSKGCAHKIARIYGLPHYGI